MIKNYNIMYTIPGVHMDIDLGINRLDDDDLVEGLQGLAPDDDARDTNPSELWDVH
jgi:hypothetical protein